MTDRSNENNRPHKRPAPQEPSTGQPAPSPTEVQPRHSSWHNLLDRAALRVRERGHRRRRAVLLFVVLLLALLFGGYRYITSDRQIELLAEEYLSNFFQTPVRIDSASFSFFEGVQVHGLRVEMEGQEEPIFAAQRLHLTHDPLALLGGRMVVRELLAVNPTINLLSRDNEWNFQRLMPQEGDQRTRGGAQRPVIYVENGVVNVRQYEGGQLTYQHGLQLSGVLQPASGRPNVFTFFASEIESGTVRGSISRGIVDLVEGTFSFEARATNVDLTPELARTLPPEARQVWDRFMPSGLVSLKVAFRRDRSDPRGFGFWIDAELSGVTLAYAHGTQRFHLEDLTGKCVISRDKLILHDVHGVLTNEVQARPGEVPVPVPPDVQGLAEAAGHVPPVSISVGMSGEVSGLDRQRLGYDLELAVGDLDLDRMRDFAVQLSPVVKSIYEDFKPAGRADVHLWIKRGGEVDAPIDLRGNVALRNGRSEAAWFPYPIEDVYGDITIEPEAVIVNLSGRNGETRLVANGQISAGRKQSSGVDLNVAVSQLQLAEPVRLALQKRYPSYLGIYDSLNPEGMVDVDIAIKRPPGGRYDTLSTIVLRDASLVYDKFPYRVERARGTIVVGSNICQIDIVGQHQQAGVAIEGTFQAGGENDDNGQGGGQMLDLMVTGHNVALDDDLAQALPEEHREIFKRYHPQGLADIVIRAQRSQATRWQVMHHTQIALKEASILFEDFPYPVEGVWGQMEISPQGFVLRDLRGTNSDATIGATGEIRRRGDFYSMDVKLTGRNVLLDRDLLGAMALHSPTLWNNLEVAGRADVVVNLKRKAEADAETTTEVAISSDDLSFMYRPMPYRFENSVADVHYDGRTVTIRSLSSRHGETEIQTSGKINLGEDGTVDARLELAASALELDADLLNALPEAMANPLRQIEAGGKLDLRIPEITYRTRADGATDVAWQGTAVVGYGRLNLGLPVDRVVAYVDQKGSYRNGELTLNAELTMPQGRIAGNDVSNLRATFQQKPGDGGIEITRLEGDLYGGKLEGGGFVAVDESGHYALNVSFRDVDLETFVRRGMKLDATIEGGLISGEVALQGAGSSFGAMQARGAMRVSDSKIYRLPIIIQLLSALRLKSGANFDSAEADFFLYGGRYTFSRLLLSGPGLALQGAGQMNSGGDLALYFTTGSGANRNIIPAISDLAAGLRHELLLVEVTGTIHQPEVNNRVLTQLTAPLRELMAIIRESQDSP